MALPQKNGGTMFKNILVAMALSLVSVGPVMADGDIKAGKKVFKKCKACHTVKEGKHKSGPSLYNIVGATAGVIEGFKYSEAMASSGIIWDEEALRSFVTKPKELIPGTRMAFSGLKKEKQVDDLIAYLKSVSVQ